MEISSLLKKTADKYIRANKDKYIAKGKAEGEKLGMKKGEKLGMEKGKAEGEKLGMANAFLEMAKRMLKDGFSIEKIMQITNLSLADIKAISL